TLPLAFDSSDAAAEINFSSSIDAAPDTRSKKTEPDNTNRTIWSDSFVPLYILKTPFIVYSNEKGRRN
ncbi:MAG: hypothetical protein IKQ63_00815, partial [Eubacterium sp.]|nr:hypothetical protein [Eubacterium sp.]